MFAKLTGWSRNTVRRYLREGDAAAVRKYAPKRAENLDPLKAYIVDRVKAAAPDRIPAVVLFREIKARGYDGAETRVKQFVRGLVRRRITSSPARFAQRATGANYSRSPGVISQLDNHQLSYWLRLADLIAVAAADESGPHALKWDTSACILSESVIF